MRSRPIDPAQPASTETSRLGFSVLELLAATALLGMLVLVVASVMNHTVTVTGASNFRMSADAGSREAMDRLAVDLASASLRSDLPGVVEKRTGNDRIAFHSEVTGYGGDRGISKLNYAMSDHPGASSPPDVPQNLVLLRGAEGTTWDLGQSLQFGSSSPDFSIDPATLEIAAPDIFRFELAFLMGDGSILSTPPTAPLAAGEYSISPDPKLDPDEQIVAVIVGVAALDSKARAILSSPSDLSILSEQLPDSVSGTEDILTQWEGQLDSVDTLPRPVVNAVRLYQRYFYLNPLN